jgi:hypothetical protein
MSDFLLGALTGFFVGFLLCVGLLVIFVESV